MSATHQFRSARGCSDESTPLEDVLLLMESDALTEAAPFIDEVLAESFAAVPFAERLLADREAFDMLLSVVEDTLFDAVEPLLLASFALGRAMEAQPAIPAANKATDVNFKIAFMSLSCC